MVMTIEKLLKMIIWYALLIWLFIFSFAAWLFDGSGEILKQFFINWRGAFLLIAVIAIYWAICDVLNDFLEEEGPSIAETLPYED